VSLLETGPYRFDKFWVDYASLYAGYADVEIAVSSPGGHSSTPSLHTSIGYLSRFIASLEDAPIYRPILLPSSPVHRYLQCLVEHGDKTRLPSWLAPALRGGHLKDVAERLSIEWGDAFRYMLETSKAVTMVGGGVKVNALPEQASAIFNSRIQVSQTSLVPELMPSASLMMMIWQPASSIQEHERLVGQALRSTAKRYDLDLYSFGERLETGSKGNVTISLVRATHPSPVTDFRGQVWDMFAQAVRSAMGQQIVVAPSLMTGNTDTQRCESNPIWGMKSARTEKHPPPLPPFSDWNLTRNIFRWSPARIGTRLNAHTVNERVLMSTHVKGARFYYGKVLYPH
jgi:Gly-Xaa carboxypeptidase